jgi:hypothetical protein
MAFAGGKMLQCVVVGGTSRGCSGDAEFAGKPSHLMFARFAPDKVQTTSATPHFAIAFKHHNGAITSICAFEGIATGTFTTAAAAMPPPTPSKHDIFTRQAHTSGQSREAGKCANGSEAGGANAEVDGEEDGSPERQS